MKNKNEEYNDFESFKRKAQTEDNYYLTIFYENHLTTINLSEYRKTFFTFGRDEDNDIVMANELHIPIDKCIYYKYMPNLNKNKLYLLDKRLVTVNKLLHIFGWSIMVYADDEVRKIYNIFPVRTAYRGFKESSSEDIENYVKISQWMKDNAEELLDEARS